MDYSLAALKLLCRQLKDARGTPSHATATLSGILFQRAWLQGILVSVDKENGKLILDDGTGTVELSLPRNFLLRPWSLGMYVMVVGAFLFRTNEPPFISVRLRFHPFFLFFLINDSLVLDM
ncbi:recQ-mediated genome instability protein 2 [Cucumis melo var. makuwa]|uniref:RecQ-mediated genome instability protein 2 n=1 Tax=Cucumis melo var. makuwa TaxID=1194695 RepID=A0A5D3BNV1_CUCMM|nr:recQ-mediated genome instability protein 2 [Cucumis melo var. makuwa]